MYRMIDGVRLAYDDAGRGDPIVLLHGFALDRSVWDQQYVALAARRRVVRIDLRGSGESACGEGPALMETLAGDVFGLLDALGVERAVIAGHGMGGYAALAFFRMYAERVAGIALIASEIEANSAERSAQCDTLIAQLETRGIAAALACYLPHALAANAAGDVRERVRAVVARQSAGGAAAQLIGIKGRVGSDDLLEDLAVPVALIAGEDDPWIPAAAAGPVAAALADCRVERLAGVGHLPMLEAPAATTAALEALAAHCSR